MQYILTDTNSTLNIKTKHTMLLFHTLRENVHSHIRAFTTFYKLHIIGDPTLTVIYIVILHFSHIGPSNIIQGRDITESLHITSR